MTARSFNLAEQYILRNWSAAAAVERSISSVREKYQVVCDHVVDDFRADHPQYDKGEVSVAQGSKVGRIWIAKSSWPKAGRWYAGLYIENLRLEYAARTEADPPSTYLYIEPFGDSQQRVAAKEVIRTAADQLLPLERRKAEFKWVAAAKCNDTAVALPFCSQAELFELLAKSEAGAFAQRLRAELEAFTAFEPVLDQVFGSAQM